jgi:hypothetical protein
VAGSALAADAEANEIVVPHQQVPGLSAREDLCSTTTRCENSREWDSKESGERTFPSGNSTKDEMSDSSTLPNLPICPCSFNPVKVPAIRQNRMWPKKRRSGGQGHKQCASDKQE